MILPYPTEKKTGCERETSRINVQTQLGFLFLGE